MRILYHALAFTAVLVLGAASVAEAQWRWTPQTGRWVNMKNLPKETPELQLEYARGLMMKEQYKQAWRETEKFQEFYDDTEFADDNQFLRGDIRLAQNKHLSAAREFQQVIASYPSTDLFDTVIKKQYEIGDALYEQGLARENRWWPIYRSRPLKRAAEVYGMVVQNQPFTAEAAEAQYKIGLCQFARDNYLEATYEYRRVVEDYPGSEWVDEASHGLAMCYYKMSLPPAYDQSPSELAIRSVDDFKARFPEDARSEELTPVRTEMWEGIAAQRLQTARFYEKRREFPSAKLYYELVATQYPGTAAAGDAQKWLDDHQMVESPFSKGIGRDKVQ